MARVAEAMRAPARRGKGTGMHCQACDKEVRPIRELTANGRTVARCPSCPTIFPDPDEKPRRRVVDVEKLAEVVALPGQPGRLAPLDAVDLDPDLLDAGQLVEMARARLDWVDAEIARLDRLKAERATLRRLIGKAK